MSEAILEVRLFPNIFIIYFLLLHIISLLIVYFLQIINNKYGILFITYLGITNLLFILGLYSNISFYIVGIIHSIFIFIDVYFYMSKNYQLNLFIERLFRLGGNITPFLLWVSSLIYLIFIF